MIKWIWDRISNLADFFYYNPRNKRRVKKQIDKDLNEYFETEIRNIKENHDDV